MINCWLATYRKGLISSAVFAVYIKFLLLPTATFFFEAYHLLKLEFLYVGYQLFKVAGYTMSVWDYRNVAAVMAGVIVFLIYLLVKKVRGGKKQVQKVA